MALGEDPDAEKSDTPDLSDMYKTNDLNGLKGYIHGFLKSFSPTDQHPLLELILLELQLAVACEENNVARSEEIRKQIDDLKSVPENSQFKPSNLNAQITEAKSKKDFDVNFKDGRVAALLDYAHLYFRNQFRPPLEKDDTFLKFSIKLEYGELKCLACRHIFDKGRGIAYVEDHITRSAKGKRKRMNLCDALTPKLGDLVEECRASKSVSTAQRTNNSSKADKSGSQKTKRGSKADKLESTPQKTTCNSLEESVSEISKRMKLSSSLSPGHLKTSGDAYSSMSKKMENPDDGDDPASVFSKIFGKMIEVGKALNSSDLTDISPLADAESSACKLHALHLRYSMLGRDVSLRDEWLNEIGTLEKSAEDLSVIHVPEVLEPMLSEFIAILFTLRCSCLKKTARGSPTDSANPSLSFLANEMLSLCLWLCNSVQVAFVGQFSETQIVALKELKGKLGELLEALFQW